jgi:hypothetical protein
MVKRETFVADKNILIAPELAFTIGCIVSNASVTNTNDDGKKVIKAGTPVGGTTSVLENRQTALTVSGDAQGIVLHDVVFENGATTANATLVVSGYVDLLKLDSDVVTAIGTAKANLTKITFMKGAK